MPFGRLTSRQVDVWLELLIVGAVVSGLTSWAIGTSALEGGDGAPCRVRLQPARAHRGQAARLGAGRDAPAAVDSVAVRRVRILVLATVGLGIAHATGLWFGVGYWSALWTHFLLAFAVAPPVLLGHVLSRPVRPKIADLDRRALLRGGATLTVGAAVYGAQEVAVRLTGLAGGSRRSTGSHEVGSFDPAQLPAVSWINDRAPGDVDPDRWVLDVARPTSGHRHAGEPQPVPSRPPSTAPAAGGARSPGMRCRSANCSATRARSIKVTSSTGYSRLFPRADADHLYLAVGYGGQPLRRRHGSARPVDRAGPPGAVVDQVGDLGAARRAAVVAADAVPPRVGTPSAAPDFSSSVRQSDGRPVYRRTMPGSRLVVLASGNGTNLQAVLDACADGPAPGRRRRRRLRPAPTPTPSPAPAPPASRRSTSGRHAGEPRADYDARLADVVAGFGPDLVVLAGWMRILTMSFLGWFPNRVVNLHPALPGELPGTTPSSGRWHEARAGERTATGVMVHLVPDEGVDDGPVLGTADRADPPRRHPRVAHRARPRRRARAARRHPRHPLPPGGPP